MATNLQRPITVKITVGLFGLLAFLSWVALGSSEPNTTSTLVALLRAIPATLAFLGVLSNTKVGRAFAIAALFLLCLSGVFGLLAAFQSFSTSPALAVVAVALVMGIFVWGAFYTFGASTRAYYSTVFEIKRANPRSA